MPDVPQPPERPWTKGKHEDHEVLHLVLEICQDSHGRVFSHHRPEEPVDANMAFSWRSGGLEQTAFALLTESVRREAVLEILLLASNKPDLYKRLLDAKGKDRETLIADLTKRLEFQLQGTISKLSEGAVEEALQAITM